MRTKIAFLFILSILIPRQLVFCNNDPDLEVKGNNRVISGRVVDEENLPLPGATVLIKEQNEGTITDANGYYRFVKLETGQYNLMVTYIGFKTQTQEVQLKAGEVATVDFKLEAGLELSEVVVNGALQGQSKSTKSTEKQYQYNQHYFF